MTAFPVAIDGLLALIQHWPALTGVRVDDGPWLDRPTDPEIIVIGWLPEEGPTVSWSSDPASLTGTDAEEFTIRGLVSVWYGDTVIKNARARAAELLQSVRNAVKSDPTLSGAVGYAYMSNLSASQYQTPEGCAVTIEFEVNAQVF